MKHPLIQVNDIPEAGTVTADLLGREVLVTFLNGKPRAYLNVCMHHGGSLTLEGDTFTCDGTARRSTYGLVARCRDRCGRTRG